jgi:origin recognition complex subunit 1
VNGATKAASVPEVKKVIDGMQNSPTAGFLRDCSFHERIMLAALLKCIRKGGVDAVKWADVSRMLPTSKLRSSFPLQLAHQHNLYLNLLLEDTDSNRRPSIPELNVVLGSLVASRALLVEGVTVARRGFVERKVMLLAEQSEVERVLSDIGGDKWKNILGTS